jgi:hypothetical protein
MRGASTQKGALPFVRDSMPPRARKTRATAEGGTKEGHFYRPLPKEFRRDCFNYRQIAREGNAAMYQQLWNGNLVRTICYEVIRIRRRERFQIAGKFVEPAEVYPRSELWGADGFTFTSSDKAWAKFSEFSLEEPARRERR